MKKRKMVQSNLIKNSIAAYFAAVELHNKPKVSYRYETVILLMMNAWELILKAYVRKYVRDKSIFTKEGYTISLNKAMDYVEEFINKTDPKSFIAIKENLLLIEDYRNNIVHYYNEMLEPYIFMLIAKAALNYGDFLKKYFSKDIFSEDGLFILPIGFKLPFKPEDFLSRRSAQYESSLESRKFIDSIVKVISDLNESNIDDSIVVGFDIYLQSVKQLKNSDLLVAITNQENADINFSKINRVQVTNDPNAQTVSLSDEDFVKVYPLQYNDVCKKCREAIPGFKQGKEFNQIMERIKNVPKLAYNRKLNPNDVKSSAKFFYAESVINEITKLYNDHTKSGAKEL